MDILFSPIGFRVVLKLPKPWKVRFRSFRRQRKILPKTLYRNPRTLFYKKPMRPKPWNLNPNPKTLNPHHKNLIEKAETKAVPYQVRNPKHYGRSPKVGNPIASNRKSNVEGIPALFGLNPVSNFMGFTVNSLVSSQGALSSRVWAQGLPEPTRTCSLYPMNSMRFINRTYKQWVS